MWQIAKVDDCDATSGDLTDSELIGISVMLTHNSGEPRDDSNVYWRARNKIQPQVEAALGVRPFKIKMTIDECLEIAEKMSRVKTYNEDSKGWDVVLMLLAEEVRRLRHFVAAEPPLGKWFR